MRNADSEICADELSPQAFKVFCSPVPGTKPKHRRRQTFFESKCANNEICVGSNPSDKALPHQAYCVSTINFVHIGHDPSLSSGSGQTIGSSETVTAGFNPAVHNGNGNGLAVEAVLTSSNNVTSVFANSMVMQAQLYNGVWRTVDDGRADCLWCASLSLTPFATTARRVKVDIVLPEQSRVGLLWLASYSYYI